MKKENLSGNAQIVETVTLTPSSLPAAPVATLGPSFGTRAELRKLKTGYYTCNIPQKNFLHYPL